MKSAIAIIAVAVVASSADGSTPWEHYLDAPTSTNAALVMAIEYSPEAHERRLSAEDLQILQNQILAQDHEAFRLALRLYHAADGGNGEVLGEMLARTIRGHPGFFLAEVAFTAEPCSEFSWILNTPGLEYVDRFEAQAYEISMRKAALRSVRTKVLRRVREECLRAFH